jgi:hypothetical protein
VPLEGRIERRISVDYYLEGARGLALQVVSRRYNLMRYMEQWEWRWTDLREKNPGLIRAMIYDPERQDWEETAEEIGRSVCYVFCPLPRNGSDQRSDRPCGLTAPSLWRGLRGDACHIFKAPWNNATPHAASRVITISARS